MEQLKLGQIITTPQNRDAVHIAVAPVTAGQTLLPGEPVGFTESNQETVGKTYAPVGIVDPFLTAPVQRGERFWMFLMPNTITGLRHEWTHPAFMTRAAVQPDVAASEQWLRDFCNSADCPGYFAVMAKAAEFCDGDTGWSDEYLHFNGSDAHGEIPPDFWMHFENVTGKKPHGDKATSFSCSC